MIDAQARSALPQKRPRKGPGTWPRYYCDPAVSPKHAKGRGTSGSPRTSPERTPRSEALELPVVKEIAAILDPYARHHEPSDVVADVLLRLLPMPDCARSTIALVVHRKGTGTCDDLTYRQAGELGACDRRTAINRFARTESYGFIRVEQRHYTYGGSAPNFVSAKIPSWVYDLIDDYRAMSPIQQPLDKPTAVGPVSAGEAPRLVSSLAPAESTAAEAGTTLVPNSVGSVTAAVASPSSIAADALLVSDAAAAASGVLLARARTEASPPAPAISPEDAAIDARLEAIHAFARQRFDVTAIRGFNAQEPKRKRGGGVPDLNDEQILSALDDYIKHQRPIYEHKTKYREPLPDRDWVENGIHVFLWGKRQLLKGLVPKPPLPEKPKVRRPEASRQRRASAPVNLAAAAAAAPVHFGATFEPGTTIVRAVRAGSIAASLLLRPGDKVVRIGDQAIASRDELRAVLSAMAPGLHTFELVRSNGVVTATVTLEPRGPPST